MPTPSLSYFDVKQFWFSASLRANLARQLALHLHPATEYESFTAGLLQDMAVQFLIITKQKEYRQIYEQWISEKDMWLHVLEREVFDFDHTTVGKLIAEHWELSDSLIDAISAHHSNVEGVAVDPAVRLVSYIRDSRDMEDLKVFNEKCQDESGIDSETLSEVITNSFENAEELSQLFQ